jgi:hypothetical protein
MNTELPVQELGSVWALCLLPKVEIQQLPELARRKSFRNSNFEIKTVQKASDYWILIMEYKGQIRRRTVSIPLYKISGGWILLFTNKAELRLARVLTKRLYPWVSRAHLINYAIEELIRRMVPSADFYVKPMGCEAITPPTEGFQGDTSKGTTRARLLGPQTEHILDLIREDVYNLWIDNLEFEIRERLADEVVVRAFLTRDGLCRVDNKPGAFAVFVRLLEGVIASGHAREIKFSNMDRRIVDNEIKISPVRVKYKRPIETFQIRMVTQDLTRKTITSVIHAGNPYFLAIAQDFLDRSTFSIAIVDDEVTVIPVKQNSEAAFARILDIVYGNIGEGEEILPAGRIGA